MLCNSPWALDRNKEVTRLLEDWANSKETAARETVEGGSMQKLDSGLDWTMDWTLDWTLDSMYFSSYRPCHHKYSPSFASLRRFCTLACMFFLLSKAGLCFPKHALICILIITLIIKAAAELPVTQNFNSSNCWGVGGGGGGGRWVL